MEQFDKYCGIQGVLALMLTAGAIFLMVNGKEVPNDMFGLLGISWGFYFSKNGTKLLSGLYSKGKDKS